MCDIQPTPGRADFCFNGVRFLCAAGPNCPNALQYFIGKVTRLCDMHGNFCMHCGRVFCPACIGSHQETCSMRPNEPGLWERVCRAIGEAGMT